VGERGLAPVGALQAFVDFLRCEGRGQESLGLMWEVLITWLLVGTFFIPLVSGVVLHFRGQ